MNDFDATEEKRRRDAENETLRLDKIAALARIRIRDEEKDEMRAQIARMMTVIDAVFADAQAETGARDAEDVFDADEMGFAHEEPDAIACANMEDGTDAAYIAGKMISMDMLREDAVRPSLPRDEWLASAPETRDGFVVVPRVVRGGN